MNDARARALAPQSSGSRSLRPALVLRALVFFASTERGPAFESPREVPASCIIVYSRTRRRPAPHGSAPPVPLQTLLYPQRTLAQLSTTLGTHARGFFLSFRKVSAQMSMLATRRKTCTWARLCSCPSPCSSPSYEYPIRSPCHPSTDSRGPHKPCHSGPQQEFAQPRSPGSPQELRSKDLAPHLESCPHRLVQCAHSGCGAPPRLTRLGAAPSGRCVSPRAWPTGGRALARCSGLGARSARASRWLPPNVLDARCSDPRLGLALSHGCACALVNLGAQAPSRRRWTSRYTS